MALIDHDKVLMEALDSPLAIADYLNEAFETGNDAYVQHAIGIVRRIAGETALAAIDRAASLQKDLAPLHVAVRFEPMQQPNA